MSHDNQSVVEVQRISKHFSGVQALDQVDLVLRKGKITALIGENGAGKSTLVKILSGYYKADQGRILLDGEEIVLDSVLHAQQKGISVIHQVPAFAPDLSVVDNIFLGRELVVRGNSTPLPVLDRAAEIERIQPLLKMYGGEMDPHRPLKKLKAYQQRLVGILKALVFSARVLILDEPTAALPLEEREILLSRILQLRDEGYTILYVSHHLDEIEKVADAIAALKDGKLVGSRETIPGQGEMIEMMTGAKLDSLGDLYRPESGLRAHRAPRVTGTIRRFDIEWELDSGRPNLFREPLSLTFATGEITLLTGLVGSGVKDLTEALFGFQRNCRVRCTSDGTSYMIDNPDSAIKKSIGYLSDDRIGEAVLPDFSIRNNMTLPKLQKVAGILGRILLKQETRAAQELGDRLNVKMRSLKQNILELSGGNQQKVMLARWLFSEVRFLILNEPTQGIDVMAKKEVMDLLFSFVAGGGSCVIATTDPEEFLPSADRVVVLRKGRITGDFSGSDIQRDAVFTSMLIQQGTTEMQS